MSSILTNMSAMSAVANLAATQKSLAETQNQISTGLKVASSKDNAGYWSIATGMRTQVSNLSAVTDALNLGTSVIGTATSALNTMISTLTQMATDITAARQSANDKPSLQIAFSQLRSQVTSAANSASFNGVNLLNGDYSNTATATFVNSVDQNGSISKIDVAGYDFTALGAGIDLSNADDTTLAGYATTINDALTSVKTASETLGATQKNIDLQATFIKSLSDSITAGVGSLVDADMNEASTRLNALQTQQQLGVQALSTANQNSQLILKLFQ